MDPSPSRGFAGFFALALAALTSMAGAQASAAGADQARRGEYLARAGDCFACHTKPGGGVFAGGAKLDTPFGAIYPPNITPDDKTGIGKWSDDEFYRALHEGIGKHGEYLYPAFPFPWYTRMTREDALAIKAYLFSLPPVNAPNHPVEFRFPFNIRATLATWRALFFKADPDPVAPPPSDTLARGAYLVEGLGHCGECHNRHNVFGASDWSGKLEGGAIEGWYAPNLTSDGRQGIGSWSEDELVTFLRTGAAPGKGVALGPMRETIDESLRYLTDEDLRAIATYLKSVPGHGTYANDQGTAFRGKGAPGQALYVENCASCHGLNGQGLPREVPALAGNGAVAAGGPENVIRVVLGGLPAANRMAPMPAGVGLADQQIAAIVDYVRNAFGNASPANVDPNQVEKLRAQTRTMMAASGPEFCPAVPDPEVKKALDAGGLDALRRAAAVDMVPAIDALLRQVGSQASPQAVVVGLTDAYCQVVFEKSDLSQARRAEQLGNFAVLAYSRIHSTDGL